MDSTDNIFGLKVNIFIFNSWFLGIGFSLEEVYQDMLRRHTGLANDEDKKIAVKKALKLPL